MKSLTIVLLLLVTTLTFAQPPDTIWTRTYGGDGDDEAYSVQQTPDGGYIVAGKTESYGAGGRDFYLVKINSEGDTLWTRTYGGGSYDEAWSVQRTADEGYIVAGVTTSFGAGNEDCYLVKTDGEGNALWTRTYGGIGDDEAWSVQQTIDGGYILAGFTASFGAGSFDFYLVKTDSLGSVVWAHTYGGSNGEYAFSVQQTIDGGYIVAGVTGSFCTGYDDFYLVKTDNRGDTLWTQTYGGSDQSRAYSVQLTMDGGYIIAGFTTPMFLQDSDFCLVKTDSQGVAIWTHIYGGNEEDVANWVQQTVDGGYIVVGRTESFGSGGTDMYLVRIASESAAEPISLSLPVHYSLHPNYPNPFNPSTRISYDLPSPSSVTLEIFDLLGRRVAILAKGVRPAGNYSIPFDASTLPSGLYFYRLQAGAFIQTQKMVLLK